MDPLLVNDMCTFNLYNCSGMMVVLTVALLAEVKTFSFLTDTEALSICYTNVVV